MSIRGQQQKPCGGEEAHFNTLEEHSRRSKFLQVFCESRWSSGKILKKKHFILKNWLFYWKYSIYHRNFSLQKWELKFYGVEGISLFPHTSPKYDYEDIIFEFNSSQERRFLLSSISNITNETRRCRLIVRVLLRLHRLYSQRAHRMVT